LANNFFKGKVVIITGASSGIGWETARLLASRGARIVLAARTAQALEKLAQTIQITGGEALVIPTNVTQVDQVNHLVAQTLSHWGQVDILIANAGQYIRAPIASLTRPIVEQSMSVNFYGGLNPILAVLPHMQARHTGHIVLVSSMDAKSPIPGDAPYVAAKYALSGFGDVLRQELNGTGIHVTTLFPGRVDTPMLNNLRVPAISAKISPQAVARAIVSGIERHQIEIILPFQAHFLNLLHFLAPSLSDWASRVFHLQGWEEERR
jgi:short-subunit dehydrogenase